MKLIGIAIITLTILGIILGGCDSASWEWFIWSKLVAAILISTAILLCHRIERRER